jgi:hypothetical protein
MTTLRIHEYKADARSTGPVEPPAVVQTPLTVSGTSQQSSAFASDTTMVRLSCDGACSVLFAANPTAVTGSSLYLSGGSILDFPVSAGLKVAVVT